MTKKSAAVQFAQAASVLFSILVLFSCQGRNNKNFISASGTIEAIEVRIAAKTSGQVEQLLVDEGDQVKKGDTLAVIDSSSCQIQLRQAEAGVDLAQAQLQLLLKGARAEDIRQAEEALNQAEANLRVAEEDWKRIRNLADKGSATPKQRDDAEARFKVAVAQNEAAKQALQKWKQLARPEEVKAAQARLEQARATRDLLQKTIADSIIISPATGTITHKATEEGEFVGPGTPLLTLTELAEVRLEIFVTESELGKIRVGQGADIVVDSHPGRVFSGEVIFIASEAEFTPKNIQTKEERIKLVYRVKIKIPNPEKVFKPGMPADAVIKLIAPASD